MAAGRGEHEPRLAHARGYGVSCTAYRFTDAPGIHAAMSEATLVISHAVRCLLGKCVDAAHTFLGFRLARSRIAFELHLHHRSPASFRPDAVCSLYAAVHRAQAQFLKDSG